ncbi:MAG: ACT domain-containing protein, partial [Actinomycetota bacterium]|nr:ACT domain-containing protein [Actinomycetota bacterium]
AVYGSDQPGIVHQVTELLAEAGINVVGLTTKVIGEASQPVYTMLLDVTLPATVDPGTLARQLDALAGRLGADCSLHPADADIL